MSAKQVSEGVPMWVLWSAVLLTLVLLGFLRLNARHQALPGGSAQEGHFDPGPDPLLTEFEREEQVARENFELRYGRFPQFFYAEGQIRSK
jgi:hypothetical protein